jgi:hypothetical protein
MTEDEIIAEIDWWIETQMGPGLAVSREVYSLRNHLAEWLKQRALASAGDS